MRDLTMEQVNSAHKVYRLLRKLKVIGIVETKTEQIRYSEFGKPIRYNLSIVSYDPTTKNKLTPEEALEELFRVSQELGLYDSET